MTTWISKVDGVDAVLAAHINALQNEKLDRDGEVAATGTLQWKKGADIVSAATLIPGSDGNYFDVTGVITITAIAATRSQPGTIIKLHFDGICQFTHHVTDLIMPGGVNYTTSAGDELEFVEYAAGDWRCTNISPAPGGGNGDGSNALSKITARSTTWDKASTASSVAALAVGYASGASDLASAASQAASVAADKASDASSAVAARSATWDKASGASAKAVAGSSNAASVAATIAAKSSAWEVGGGGVSSEYDNGVSGAAKTINWNNGRLQKITLTAACTITFTAPTSGVGLLSLRVVQDATGGRFITWPSAKFPGGVEPVLSQAASSVDIIKFYYSSGVYYCENFIGGLE